MHSGQTRAVLMRKARAGIANGAIIREKRMSDLAWQMNVMSQKLSACPREKRSAKERLMKLYGEAKAEYDRLSAEMEIENAPQDFGFYLGYLGITFTLSSPRKRGSNSKYPAWR